MTLQFERIILGVAIALATVAQLFLAPHIAIGSAIPNFFIVLSMVVSITNSRHFNCLLPFCLGLAFDLMSGGPVGAMAFSLTAFSVVSAWFYESVNNDTIFMALLTLFGGTFLVQLSYGVFLLLFGNGINPIDAFAVCVFPCFLYDFVLACIFYLLAIRIFGVNETSQPMIGRIS